MNLKYYEIKKLLDTFRETIRNMPLSCPRSMIPNASHYRVMVNPCLHHLTKYLNEDVFPKFCPNRPYSCPGNCDILTANKCQKQLKLIIDGHFLAQDCYHSGNTFELQRFINSNHTKHPYQCPIQMLRAFHVSNLNDPKFRIYLEFTAKQVCEKHSAMPVDQCAEPEKMTTCCNEFFELIQKQITGKMR